MTLFRKQPETHYQTPNFYLRIELALRLRRSAFWALASATRLARIWAYSFYTAVSTDTLEFGRKFVHIPPRP